MKSKKKYDNNSRSIKKVLKGKPLKISKWEVEPISDKRGQDKMGKLTKVSDPVLEAMARDKVGGTSEKDLAEKYGLSVTYVREALQRFYVTSRKGKEILKGIYLEGAIATGAHALTKIGEMTGPQAAAVSKIFTDSLIDIEKHDANSSKEINVDALEDMAASLKDIAGALTNGEEDEEGGESVLD